MKRKIEYNVVITFANAKVERVIGKHEVPYYLGQGNTDSITFHKKKIKMLLRRSRVYSAQDILSKPSNTINSQIIKALILYYLNATNFPTLKNIQCTITSTTGANTVLFNLDAQSLPKILNHVKERSEHMRLVPTDIMMNEDRLGVALRVSSSYWLHAINTDNCHLRFTYLWVSFNALFGYYGNKKMERENLIYIRNVIVNHPELFVQSIDKVRTYADSLREKFRWMLMCKNDIKRSPNNFCERIAIYNDQRILHLFEQLIASDQLRLKVVRLNRYADLQMKFAAANGTSDIEIVALLCVRYAYFLRNRRMHGKVIDSSFELQITPEEEELHIINDLLSILILEILTNSDRISVNPD